MSVFPSKGQLIVFIASAIRAFATYYMDDSNSTVQYRGPGWKALTPADVPFLASPEIYNHTV
jgi:hypothetical protein